MTKTNAAATKVPEPPAGLSADALYWWRRLTEDYTIDEHDSAGRLLLEVAMRALDQMRAAEESIAEHGQVTMDAKGVLKPNPSCVILRDSRSAVLAALKSLNLDLEPLHTRPGRPGKG